MEPSELMKIFPKFSDYLATQQTYEQIKNNLNQNLIVSQNLARFSLNLPVYERKEINNIIYPPGWEEYFNECQSELENALTYVNSQIRLGKIVFPKEENLFRAFQLTQIDRIRVIIVGQDAYHSRDSDTGEPVANGCSFSCNGRRIQPSLQNIFKELQRTFGMMPSSGNLDHWGLQGVLMINKCLTVNEGEPLSHGDAWKFFIHKILNIILAKVPFCFLCLWGAKAQKLVEGRDKLTFNSQRVMVLKAGHPSSLNIANPFIGNDHFKIINEILYNNGQPMIDWLGHSPVKK